MKKGLYPRLAWTGICKNYQMYVPYILTCIGMIMMYYIVTFLSQSDMLNYTPSKTSMESMLSLGSNVIGFFALIFLFYSNSFLIRRRKTEFGLYNILGMGKWNLVSILIWESIGIAVISLTVGLFCGILFSKVSELVMMNIIGETVSFSFSISFGVIGKTILLFLGIFLVILLNSLRQIHVSNPIELLNSSNIGEKPPKVNWVLAVLGMILLAAAYYIALSIQQPIAAFTLFFGAVILVIIATYFIFIAGSVALCRVLQKNKRYYYRTNHFISVSSMTYRMKRNGAGLATICILSTMILVMLSTTICMFSGTEDSLKTMFPRSIILDIYSTSQDVLQPIEESVEAVLQESNYTQENDFGYAMLGIMGSLEGNHFHPDVSEMDLTIGSSGLRDLIFVSLEDYNRIMGENEKLASDEVLLYSTESEDAQDIIEIEGYKSFKVKKTVTKFADNEAADKQIINMMILFVPDLQSVAEHFDGQKNGDGDDIVEYEYYTGFDLNCNEEEQIQFYKKLSEKINNLKKQDDFPQVYLYSRAEKRNGFYAIYGGLLFLGILLSIVFVFAAVLIIYYKQISEGYEDRERFTIMQKVGMTKSEIRKSINSQILTVFFLPLIAAGVHLGFAFPMISKVLVLFNLTNQRLLVGTTVGCYFAFGLFYVIVYKITSHAYYHLVSQKF